MIVFQKKFSILLALPNKEKKLLNLSSKTPLNVLVTTNSKCANYFLKSTQTIQFLLSKSKRQINQNQINI